MDISLREGNRDPGFAEGLINGCVQLGDGYQAIVQIGQVAAQQKVQRAVTESFECRNRRRILENIGMFLGCVEQQLAGQFGVRPVGDAGSDYNPVNRIGKGPV